MLHAVSGLEQKISLTDGIYNNDDLRWAYTPSPEPNAKWIKPQTEFQTWKSYTPSSRVFKAAVLPLLQLLWMDHPHLDPLSIIRGHHASKFFQSVPDKSVIAPSSGRCLVKNVTLSNLNRYG